MLRRKQGKVVEGEVARELSTRDACVAKVCVCHEASRGSWGGVHRTGRAAGNERRTPNAA